MEYVNFYHIICRFVIYIIIRFNLYKKLHIMKATLLFLSVFSFSIFTFASDCETAMSKEDHKQVVKAITNQANFKVPKARTLLVDKCIDAEQMLELLNLVETKEDKLAMFDILAGKLIKSADYGYVKRTFLN